MENLNLLQIALVYLAVINVATFFTFGIDKWKAKKSMWRIRETALLMIVDSVEAAVRAANIRDLGAGDKIQTVSAIEKIVNQVVASKINENQFDDVDFTQKDLARIKKTLVEVLTSMYHTRKVKKIETRK